METFQMIIQAINSVLWHDYVLYSVLATGLLFTIWSISSQYRALTHGTAVTLGHYDDPYDPGAINHFQALSTALSATVGLGNIGGVAIAIGLGGPGAVFWMWVVGLLGMSIKVMEVTLAMMYRNLDDPDNPHGGPMWVVKKAFAEKGPGWAKIGAILGGIYCVGMLVGAFVGGNMFQAWNVAEVSSAYFGWSKPVIGAILAVLVGAVLIGGIKRIGQVTSFLVPIMCLIYIIAGLYVIFSNIELVPETIVMIVTCAFNPTEAQGAFIGGTMGSALLWGMKRALYSSEVGQGSSAIAHAAAKTSEPVREGLVAGLEPFIDTLVVCTITAMVILLTGVWNRGPDAHFETNPLIIESATSTNALIWTSENQALPQDQIWQDNSTVFMIRQDGEGGVVRWYGTVSNESNNDESSAYVVLNPISSDVKPVLVGGGIYQGYAGASLTAHAFDQTHNGLGKWLVTIAAWMFALSTIISWGYYGEQGINYLFGQKVVLPYKLVFCVMSFVATTGIMRTTQELDAFTTMGSGILLIVCLPITLMFGHKAIAAYRDYIRRLKAGDFDTDYHKTSFKALVGTEKTE